MIKRVGSRPSFVRRFMRHRGGLVGAVVMLTLAALALLAPLIAPYDPAAADVLSARQAPTMAHWLGTDEIGRDILSRLLYGAQISLRVGVIAVGVGAGIGVPVGALSGYVGGLLDLLVQRVIDTLQAFPGILLAILISAVAGASLELTIAALGTLSIPVYARLVRGGVLAVKQLAYVDAARTVGCSPLRVVGRHVLPNALSPVFVQSSLQFAFSVLLLAGLGFLGLGAQPPTPEWGVMLAQGRVHLRSAPHIVIFAAIVISITVLALNLIGDALRDALDPRGIYEVRR
jgi:ABC-type dipeptide/oligopeptide/nickel transport system permease subunit